MNNRSLVLISAGLILLSISLYSVQYFIFRDINYILFYLISNIAFIPIEVLIVTVILQRLLESHERSQRLEKLNMVIGVFYNRVGTVLLDIMIKADEDLIKLRNELIIIDSWSVNDFERARMKIEGHIFNIKISTVCIMEVKKCLEENGDFLVQLLENPVVLEHDSFTELLQAVFHAMDELERRKDFGILPPSDIAHIQLDLQRVYKQLVISWISYMQYLKRKYPYLFSLAIRTNPFDETASVVIK